MKLIIWLINQLNVMLCFHLCVMYLCLEITLYLCISVCVLSPVCVSVCVFGAGVL